MDTTTTTQKNEIVLAFDIERSGPRLEHDTIAIGACVLDWTFKELDRLCLLGYFPKPDACGQQTEFDPKTWEEFWSKHQDTLTALTYTGTKTKKAREEEIVEQVQAFRRKWELNAEKNNLKLEVCTDNNVFDGGFINCLLFEYSKQLPFPYSTQGEYRPFWETHSQQRGLLMAVDPGFKQDWGYSQRINELYDIPAVMEKPHDHNPANDAYTIAFDQQVLLHIRDGQIKLKK